MTSVIIDPNAFDAPQVQAEADAFVDWVKASPLADGTDSIMVPGEPEQARRAERLAGGVPIDSTTWRQICDAAVRLGMGEGEAESFGALLK